MTVAKDRETLAKLARSARMGMINVQTSARALELGPRAAAMKLAGFARRGWLRRIRRGLYLIVPLEVSPQMAITAEDPWMLAVEAFSPCYIGGWTAAEHWGLTEQLFRETLVVTSANVRSTRLTLLNNRFRLYRSSIKSSEGISMVWRQRERIPVSSPERTIIDGLRRPEICGGMRHLTQILLAYSDSKEFSFPRLLDVAHSTANGAAWKRLGYLVELFWPQFATYLPEIEQQLTTGYVKLDPSVGRSGPIAERWRITKNVDLSRVGSHD